MCGRFTQFSSPSTYARRFGIDAAHVPDAAWSPRYNLAPSQQALVVRTDANGARRLDPLSWGFVPSWAKDLKGIPKPINARAETVNSKPMFRGAFRRHRCFVPCDGFYEWKATDTGKQPFFIHLQDDQPFALAGLWDHWEGEGHSIDSFTILVTGANALMAQIHDRMPVILPEMSWTAWLDPQTTAEDAMAILGQYDAEAMAMHAVSKRVNSPFNEGESLVKLADA